MFNKDKESYSIHRVYNGQIEKFANKNYMKNADVFINTNKKELFKTKYHASPWKELLQKKETHRQKFLKRKEYPVISINNIGNATCIELKYSLLGPLDDKKVLSSLCVEDIQRLLLFPVNYNRFDYAPRWCTFKRINKASHIVAIIVDGVEINGTLSSDSNSTGNILMSECIQFLFPKCARCFPQQYEVISPAMESTILNLLCCPLGVSQKKKKWKEESTFENCLIGDQKDNFARHIRKDDFNNYNQKVDFDMHNQTDKFDRQQLLLSIEELVQNGFPSPIDSPGYVYTKEKYAKVTSNSPMFSIDCEMCLTERGKQELASVSLVNEECKLVYHSYVKPASRIVNYCTRYSGITKDILRDVTTTLEDVQKTISDILPSDAILVGHSLNFDLESLQLLHPYVIDTSLIFNLSGHRNMKSSLKTLSKLFLGLDIQTGYGHDATEDATAAMKLVKLKLSKDLYYADSCLRILTGDGECSQRIDMNAHLESIISKDFQANSVFDLFMGSRSHNDNKSCKIIAQNSFLHAYKKFLNQIQLNADTELVDNNKMVFQQTCEAMSKTDFVFAYMKVSNDIEPDKKLRKVYRIDKYISDIYHAAEEKTLVILYATGCAQSVSASESKGFVSLKIKKTL